MQPQLIDNFMITSRWQSSLETIPRKVSALSREPALYYIGRTSGTNAKKALTTRYDDFKKSYQPNSMYAVFKSSSESATGQMERALVDYYYGHGLCINRVPDGRGKTGAGPYYFVYVAVSER